MNRFVNVQIAQRISAQKMESANWIQVKAACVKFALVPLEKGMNLPKKNYWLLRNKKYKQIRARGRKKKKLLILSSSDAESKDSRQFNEVKQR